MNYPVSFNLSTKTIKTNHKLIADRKNASDFVGGAYAVFPLDEPTNIISTKLQLTGTRVSTDGANKNDWVLELHFFDIFGTLYEMSDKIIIPSQCEKCLEGQKYLYLAVFILDPYS